MVKEVVATFRLTSSEIEEALYEFFVKKLKSNNINAVFSSQDIKVDFNDFLEVKLVIFENKDIE